MEYHDKEWGVPVHDDRKQFEFLVLESAQAGLSWITILKRREGYRKQYANFDAQQVARYDDEKIIQMLKDTGIIRNRKKHETKGIQIPGIYHHLCAFTSHRTGQ